MPDIAELSEAFEPCTIRGLAKRLWECYGEQRALGREMATLKQALTAWCEKTGEVIEVEGQPDLRLYHTWGWNSYAKKGEQEWTIRFDETQRRAKWLETQK